MDHPLKLLVATAGLSLAVAAACSGSDSGSGSDDRPAPRPLPQEVDEGAGDFYAVPDPIPDGEHGDLLRYQRITDPPDGVTWYRVMYLSETVAGAPTVVTGVVTVPDGAAPAGGRPLVTHAHGSTGLADPCAPSISVDVDRTTVLELVLVSSLAASHGAVVASTDYEGLGGPGRHPFLVGESEGRSVLDIARAARQLPDVEIGPSTAIAGYSQGGHAALWANQIAADWAPDLAIVGTMAGAPATELTTLGAGAARELREPLQVLTIAGLAAAYPDADPATILTPAGRAFVEQLDAGCPAAPNPDTDSPLLSADPTTTEPWAGLLADNTPGGVSAEAPVLVIHSAADMNVLIDDSARLLDRLCAAGQVVERRVLPTGDHVAAAIPAYEQAFTWFDTLTQGTPPQSSCP